MLTKNTTSFFDRALELAQHASLSDEVPVGAVIVKNDIVISATHNRMRHTMDATAHAEILCLREACGLLKSQHLVDCDIYVTLEPCPMCAGAIANARIRRVIFGAYDPKGGAIDHGARLFEHTLHKPEVIGGIKENQCTQLLRDFFESKR